MECTACWRAPVRNNCAAVPLVTVRLFALSCDAGSLCRHGINGASVQHFLLYLLALGAGVSVATQQVLNGSLRTALGSPAWAGLVSYAGGLITMIIAVIALGERVPSWKTAVDVPWYAWSGGVFGAAFILLAILLLPSLGAATLFALVIAGQVLAAVTLDHFGAFGLTPHPIGAARLAGAVLLIAGVVLIRD